MGQKDKSLTDHAKGRLKKILLNSIKAGNKKEDILRMILHHADEIKELSEKGDSHAAIETGDMIILCLELLEMSGESPDEILECCFARFDCKLQEILSGKKP